MTGDRWLAAWALGSVALGGASLLVPLYFVAIGGDALLLGVLAGVAAAAGAPGAVIAGRLADRTGKRRAYVLAALGVVAVVLAVLPLTETTWLVVLGNGVVWFAAGAIAPVVTLLVTVGHDESEWSDRFGTLNRAQGWGWAGGLVLGTVWTAAGSALVGPALAQRTLFLACAACAAGSVLLGARWFPADPGTPDRRRARRLSAAISRARRLPVRSATFPVGPGRVYWLTRSADPRTLVDRLTPALAGYFLAVLAVFTGFGVFWGPLPLYLTGEGYQEAVVFALYLVSSLGSAVSFNLAGRLAGRHDSAGVQTVGLVARGLLHPAVAVVGLLVPASLVATGLTGLLFALIGVAWALVAVTAATLVTRLAPASIRGEAIGLYTALSGLASGVGSVLGGWLAGRGFVLAFAVAGALVMLGALGTGLLWLSNRETA